MNFPGKVTVTFRWLNSDRAKLITGICKQHGGSVKRLAQERGALGICKIIVSFNQFPGWYDNSIQAGKCKQAVIAAGLTNGLTF